MADQTQRSVGQTLQGIASIGLAIAGTILVAAGVSGCMATDRFDDGVASGASANSLAEIAAWLRGCAGLLCWMLAKLIGLPRG